MSVEFDFEKIFTSGRIRRWIMEHPEKLHDSECYGFDLKISDDIGFSEKSGEKHPDEIPIFIARFKEEAFCKMLTYCSENLICRKTSQKILLYHYPKQYLDDIVENGIKFSDKKIGSGKIYCRDNKLYICFDNDIGQTEITDNILKYADLFIGHMIEITMKKMGFDSDTGNNSIKILPRTSL